MELISTVHDGVHVPDQWMTLFLFPGLLVAMKLYVLFGRSLLILGVYR
jgi:hypothetical protein